MIARAILLHGANRAKRKSKAVAKPSNIESGFWTLQAADAKLKKARPKVKPKKTIMAERQQCVEAVVISQ